MKSEPKIKQAEVAGLRRQMLRDQGYKCGLCGKLCNNQEAALDHDHRTGRVRGVLHSSCNILLGKVENFTGRYGQALIREGRLKSALIGMPAYMDDDYSRMPLHYRHKTPEDKLLAKYRQLKRRSIKPETKLKYENLIKETQLKYENLIKETTNARSK